MLLETSNFLTCVEKLFIPFEYYISVIKVKPKSRSTKSLGPGHRKEPAYKSRRFHIHKLSPLFKFETNCLCRKTITTLGAVDIIPSLPEDQPTVSLIDIWSAALIL